MAGESQSIVRWYEGQVRGFLTAHAPARVGELDADASRTSEALDRLQDPVPICFLGKSGVGKSSLLNAVAVGAEVVLPAGGCGPLTAQAITICRSPEAFFRVRYHAPKELWTLTLVLERQLRRESQRPPAARAGGESDPPPATKIEERMGQARLLVTGDQRSDAPLEYLIDALRWAMGQPVLRCEPREADRGRLLRIRTAVLMGKGRRAHERRRRGDDHEYLQELRDHAAGFMSPLIKQIEVGVPTDALRDGMLLVDLPGVGIANDVYRGVTARWVREQARAVVLVVDSRGIDQASADLLHESGFVNRLLHSADDPDADPVALIVAVTRVDDAALAEWRQRRSVGQKKCTKAEVLREVRAQIDRLIRDQMRQQLEGRGHSSSRAAAHVQVSLVERLLEGLIVCPVSAPQYQQLLLGDEDDPPFIKDERDSGVPQFREELQSLCDRWRATLRERADEAATTLGRRLDGALRVLAQEQRTHEGLLEAEVTRLRRELAEIGAPFRAQLENRRGAYREFLATCREERIRALVREAMAAASEDIRRYLQGLRGAHWCTLRAAVRRGGAYDGARRIDVPGELALQCEAPVVALWGARILQEVRTRTSELARGYLEASAGLLRWGEERQVPGLELMAAHHQELEAAMESFSQVGRELVDEAREHLRRALFDTIEEHIQEACDQFVQQGEDRGAGVKQRMLSLFDGLAGRAVELAGRAIEGRLREEYRPIEQECRKRLQELGDPFTLAELAVSRGHEAVTREERQQRALVAAEIEALRESRPRAAEPTDVKGPHALPAAG